MRSARRATTTLATITLAASALTLSPAHAAPTAQTVQTVQTLQTAANPPTPGNFRGYGFDQCLAPTQTAMDRWLSNSPFMAVGIYISGDSRGCRSQPNLTPTWVATQLRKGWRLLPITLGPQASCSASFPRYGNDKTIDPTPGRDNWYGNARKQGRDEAVKAVAEAKRLGIVPTSTLWYDLEAFDTTQTRCRESALGFLSGWSGMIRAQNYRSGVYSSAGSGIKVLDQARINRPKRFNLPDDIWMARWDGVANTSTSYISEQGWNPNRRIKQYRGGHQETWGGVTINIDSNFLDVGRGAWAPAAKPWCGSVEGNYRDYPALSTNADPARTKVIQCFLKVAGLYSGPLDGKLTSPATQKAIAAWRVRRKAPGTGTVFSRNDWARMLSTGAHRTLKYGVGSLDVRRLQRALNAGGAGLTTSGVFDRPTEAAVKKYKQKHGLVANGVVTSNVWRNLQNGKL